MFGSIDWTSIFGLLLVCFTILGAVKLYLVQSERSQKREHEQELMKVRLYTDRDVKTAQIESSALQYGFSEPAETDGSQQLLNMVLQNPDMIKGVIENLKK